MKVDAATLNRLSFGADRGAAARSRGDGGAFGQLLDGLSARQTSKADAQRESGRTDSADRREADNGRVKSREEDVANTPRKREDVESQQRAEAEAEVDREAAGATREGDTEARDQRDQSDAPPAEPTPQPDDDASDDAEAQFAVAAVNEAARSRAGQAAATAQPQSVPAEAQAAANAAVAVDGEGVAAKRQSEAAPLQQDGASTQKSGQVRAAAVPGEGAAASQPVVAEQVQAAAKSQPAAVAADAEQRPAARTESDLNRAQQAQATTTRAPAVDVQLNQQTGGEGQTSSDEDGQPGERQPQTRPTQPIEARAASFNLAARGATTAEPTAPTVEVATATTPTPTPTAPQGGAATAALNTPGMQADVDPVADRAIRGLQSVMAQRGGNVTLRLNPPDLGSLRIDVRFTGGAVRATFQASTATAGSILHHNIAALRAALESHGLTVDQLTVQAPHAPSAGANSQAGQHATQQDAQQSPGDGRSRGFNGDGTGDGSSDHQQDTHDQRRRRFEQALLDLVG